MVSGAPVLIKVCGVTSVEDALAAARLGVHWIGLNFHPDSPRCISPATAAAIVGALPNTCGAVGVFVDRPPAEVVHIAQACNLVAIQLHGNETPEDVAALRALHVVKAFRLGGEDDLAMAVAFADECRELGVRPFAWLFDARHSTHLGGTGRTISDALLQALKSRQSCFERMILAGGLTPINVQQRIATLQPWMVDVASGVESAPGRKDPSKLAAFIQAARAV